MQLNRVVGVAADVAERSLRDRTSQPLEAHIMERISTLLVVMVFLSV